jgi:hypothetical protein
LVAFCGKKFYLSGRVMDEIYFVKTFVALFCKLQALQWIALVTQFGFAEKLPETFFGIKTG